MPFRFNRRSNLWRKLAGRVAEQRLIVHTQIRVIADFGTCSFDQNCTVDRRMRFSFRLDVRRRVPILKESSSFIGHDFSISGKITRLQRQGTS